MPGNLLRERLVLLPVILAKLVDTGAIRPLAIVKLLLRDTIKPVIDLIALRDDFDIGLSPVPVFLDDQDNLVTRSGIEPVGLAGVQNVSVIIHQLVRVAWIRFRHYNPLVFTLRFGVRIRNERDAHGACPGIAQITISYDYDSRARPVGAGASGDYLEDSQIGADIEYARFCGDRYTFGIKADEDPDGSTSRDLADRVASGRRGIGDDHVNEIRINADTVLISHPHADRRYPCSGRGESGLYRRLGDLRRKRTDPVLKHLIEEISNCSL